jgi:hypothetical protein
VTFRAGHKDFSRHFCLHNPGKPTIIITDQRYRCQAGADGSALRWPLFIGSHKKGRPTFWSIAKT